uniref:Uncharacterized protein n=1 Tax=Solanum tuberosum TaxID=4113 RepID=M1DCM1_SOLTU
MSSCESQPSEDEQNRSRTEPSNIPPSSPNLNLADHSASLVGIVNQFDDSPFGVVRRRLAPAFSIVVLWVIGRHGTASQNF